VSAEEIERELLRIPARRTARVGARVTQTKSKGPIVPPHGERQLLDRARSASNLLRSRMHCPYDAYPSGMAAG